MSAASASAAAAKQPKKKDPTWVEVINRNKERTAGAAAVTPKAPPAPKK